MTLSTHRLVGIRETMISGVDHNVGTDESLLTEYHGSGGRNRHATVEDDTVAQDDILRITYCHPRIDS